MKAPRAGLEGSIYAGIRALTDAYLGREWRRDDGAAVRIDRCLIDANWGNSTDVVYQFCRESPHSALLLPSHGRFVGASSVPFSEYKRKRGDRVGHNWRIPNVQGRRAVRHVVYDANYWKSFCYARLAVPMGDRGCLSIFGEKSDQHRQFADHITAEYRVKTEGRGRTLDEWKIRPEKPDNHWLDCLVGWQWPRRSKARCYSEQTGKRARNARESGFRNYNGARDRWARIRRTDPKTSSGAWNAASAAANTSGSSTHGPTEEGGSSDGGNAGTVEHGSRRGNGRSAVARTCDRHKLL